MRVLLAFTIVATAGVMSANESKRVDGVPVSGKLHDVSVADIRNAIAAYGEKPVALEVISSSEIHVYLRSRDLGWRPVWRNEVVEPDGRRHPGWNHGWWGIRDTPPALRLIRTADQVLMFPITTPSKPHRDDKRLRLLSTDARRELVRLLSHQNDWFQGSYGGLIMLEPERRNIGFIFRRGGDELVLFFRGGGVAEGTFNGQHTGGLLEDERGKQLEEWKRHYARPELAQRRSN